MENADGNCFSKSKLYIEDGTEVVKNNRKHCWISVSLSIQGEAPWQPCGLERGYVRNRLVSDCFYKFSVLFSCC